MSSTDSQTETTSMTHEGRVKWFNNKAGYGFISVIGGENDGMDVFAHHSAIQVSEEQYKYLVQGEYVNFEVVKMESGKHEWQSSDIRGINGWKLMCESRHEIKLSRNAYKTSKVVQDNADK